MGKGSKARPLSVSLDKFDTNWDRIFSKREDNTGTDKNEYYDILTTEECVLSALEKMTAEEALQEMVKISEEMGDYVNAPIDNPLIKK